MAKLIICPNCKKEKVYWAKELCRKCYNKGYHKLYLAKPEVKERIKEYYQKNRERILERKKQYNEGYNRRLEIKKRRKEFDKKKYQRTSKLRKEQNKKWYQTNKLKVIDRHKKYYRTLRYKELNRKHNNKRNKIIENRLSNAISRQIRYYLKTNKNGKHWEELVSFTLDELKKSLEKQFNQKMTWKNYGSYWVIDHRIPVSWFNFNSYKDENFKKCWSLDNLKPMKKEDNISKKNYYAEPTLNRWKQ